MFSGLLYCADYRAKLYFYTCKSYKDDSQNYLSALIIRVTAAPAKFTISKDSCFTELYWKPFSRH